MQNTSFEEKLSIPEQERRVYDTQPHTSQHFAVPPHIQSQGLSAQTFFQSTVINSDSPPPLPPRRKQAVVKPAFSLQMPGTVDYNPSRHISPIPMHKPISSHKPPPPPYPHLMTTDQLQLLKQAHYNSDSPFSSHSPSPSSSVHGPPTSNVFNLQSYPSPTAQVTQSPMPAIMHKWQNNPVMFMGKVESEKVHFPEAQTATGPTLPTQQQYHLNNPSLHNSPHFTPQQYYQVNTSPTPTVHYNVQGPQPIIPILHTYGTRPSTGQNAYQQTNTVQQQQRYSRQPSVYHPSDFQAAFSVRAEAMSHRFVANQSPVSVQSTSSTRSTNSDIPDKPPPPYPGSHHPHGNQKHPSHFIHQHPHQHSNGSNSIKSYLEQLEVNHLQFQEVEPEIKSIPQSISSAIPDNEKEARTSPKPDRDPEAQKKEQDGQYSGRLKSFSSQAYKFFMEQHIENIFKSYEERKFRMEQLHKELANTELVESTKKHMIQLLYKKESNYLRSRRANMNRSMFVDIKPLGVGAFGSVTLVQKVNTHQLYAMKTLRKSDVLKRNQIAHVKAERDILAEADNEWVVKLYYSFQDCHNLYFVMDYIQGGDMMGRLQKEGIFEPKLAQFYITELVLAVESVHDMGFIHRDIKPDNILIDKDGHIKLTDFGLCTGFRWTHNSKLYQNGKYYNIYMTC